MVFIVRVNSADLILFGKVDGDIRTEVVSKA